MTKAKAARPVRRRPPMRRKKSTGQMQRPHVKRLSHQEVRMRELLSLALKIIFVWLFIAGGIYSLYVLWNGGFFKRQLQHTIHWMLDKSAHIGFVVHDVYVYGRERTDKQTLEQILPFSLGSPLFSYDLQQISSQLRRLPWVQDVAIQRHLPARIDIHLVERQPLALWQLDTDIYLIDTLGQIIPDQDLTAYDHLLLVVGAGANTRADDLLDLLSQNPRIKQRVVAGIWVGNRRWNLLIDNGIFVNLPEEAPDKAYQHLAHLEETHRILQKNVRVIDMRLEDRLILELPEAPDTSSQGRGRGNRT